MSRKFLAHIDLNSNELQNAVIQNLSSAPNGVLGRIYFDTSAGLNQLKIYNGTAWSTVGSVTLTLQGEVTGTASTNSSGQITLTTTVDYAGSLTGADVNTALGYTAADAADVSALATSINTTTIGATTINTVDLNASGAINLTGSLSSNLNANSHKITNLTNPTNPQDAATKSYVDSTSQGLDVKPSVRVATTANATLSTAFANGQVIDGVTLVTGDRILIKHQSTGSENGIYTVNSTGAPTRAVDADVSSEVTAGMFVFVSEGTTNGNSGWVLTTDDVITLGTTALVFAQFSGAGTYTSSDGVLLTGSNFTFAPLTTGGLATASGGASIKLQTNSGAATTSDGFAVGAGTGIVVNTNNVAIDTSIVVRKYGTNIGTGSATSITVTHNLGTKDVSVTLFDNSTPYAEVVCDVEHTTTNTVTLLFSVAPTSSQYRVVVLG
jgi:hypothetical protein